MISNCKDYKVRSPITHRKFSGKVFNETEEQEFRLTRDIHGNCHYTVVGSFKVSDYIQSFKAGCALSSILERTKLMPVRDRISYLQQNDSFSADLSNLPLDGTEAFVLLHRMKQSHPELFKRFSSGESFDSIVKEMFNASKSDSKAEAKSDANNSIEGGNE